MNIAMSWLYNVRKFFFSQSLKNLNRSKHQLIAWNEVNTISILVPFFSLDQQEQIQNALDYFSKKAIRVNILVYKQDDKQTTTFPSFSPKEIGWNLVPNSEAVNNFTNQETDVLFAFYAHENLTMDYIVQKSIARCKVGYFAENKTDCFDFMLKPNHNSSQTILQLIEQSIQYLQKIENKK